MWGERFAIIWGGKRKTKKQIMKNTSWLSAASKRMIFNTTTNQKQAATTEGTKEGRRDEREAWGKQGTIVLMAL